MISRPKKCPIEREFFEEQYINLNKSIVDIAKEFNYSKSTIYCRLKKFDIIRSISESNKGKKNGMWKGDKVKYNALHEWIKNNKRKIDLCEICGKRSNLDLANISGEYKRDIDDYKWLCRGCHMKMDYKNKTRKYDSKRLRKRKGELFRCNICKEFKDKSQFYKNNIKKDKIGYDCKKCERIRYIENKKCNYRNQI